MASIYDWSTTAAANSTADSTINFAEGMDPGDVNDSARALMARVAQFLDDLGGVATAGGTANAITVTAASAFSALANGLIVAFSAASDNTGATTLSVNGLTAKSVRIITGNGDEALSGGEIQSGGVFLCIYKTALNGAAGGWQLINPAALGVWIATVQGSAVSLSNSSTSAQNIFAAANDTLTVVASTTYRFRARLLFNTGTTTHTTAFGLGGTATFTSIAYTSHATSSAADTLATPQTRHVATASAAVLTATSVAATTNIVIEGVMRINAAGTIIPQVTFSAGPTGTCETAIDSYFEIEPIGSNTVAAVGPWA